MSLKQGEIKYILKRGFSFAGEGGQFEDADHIILREPTIKHAKSALKLRQMIKKSEFELGASVVKMGIIDDDVKESNAGDKVPKIETLAEQWDKESEKITSQVKMQLETSSIDLNKFAETFWKMAFQKGSAVCLINGTVRAKDGILDDISLDDYLGVAITYCSFFVTLSDNDRKIISEEQSD